VGMSWWQINQNGFTSHDAAVLQGMAHWMGHRLAREDRAPTEKRTVSSYLPCNFLNRIGDGVFVLDESRRLLWANAAWLEWTGFSLDELTGHVAPYPFWISHRVLAQLSQRGELPAQLLFEGDHQTPGTVTLSATDDTIFWCQLETVKHETADRCLVLALLRPTPLPASHNALAVTTGNATSSFRDAGRIAPSRAALTDHGGRIVWANDHFFNRSLRPPWPWALHYTTASAVSRPGSCSALSDK